MIKEIVTWSLFCRVGQQYEFQDEPADSVEQAKAIASQKMKEFADRTGLQRLTATVLLTVGEMHEDGFHGRVVERLWEKLGVDEEWEEEQDD